MTYLGVILRSFLGLNDDDARTERLNELEKKRKAVLEKFDAVVLQGKINSAYEQGKREGLWDFLGTSLKEVGAVIKAYPLEERQNRGELAIVIPKPVFQLFGIKVEFGDVERVVIKNKKGDKNE